jgi:hypothetical protein
MMLFTTLVVADGDGDGDGKRGEGRGGRGMGPVCSNFPWVILGECIIIISGRGDVDMETDKTASGVSISYPAGRYHIVW